MIDTKAVSAFFDRLAPTWDADMIRDDRIIGTILDNAHVRSGAHVLDVACGTGVLFPDYLSRSVASVTAIDLSPEMVRIAQQKCSTLQNVRVLCGDVTETAFFEPFDCIVVYNALPHFADPDRLIAVLASLLAPGGYLTVAHGMSRERINRHHENLALPVCTDLMPANELAALFAQHLDVTFVCSDDSMYQVAGRKRV